MRSLFISFCLLFVFTYAEAQQEVLRSDGRRTQVDTYLRALKTLHLPYGEAPTFDGGLEKEGSIFYNTADSALYIWNGDLWAKVDKDIDLSPYYTKTQTDSIFEYYPTIAELNLALALKVDKTTKVNGYELTGDIVLTADDVGALTKALADTYYKDIDWVPAWSEITNKPTEFTPAPHTHPVSDVVGLQGLLDGKQATITGAASTITTNDLAADRALVSNGSGKVATSEVTAAELGRLSGVTSLVQTQIDSKVDKTTTINNTGGINIGGSLSSGSVSLGLNDTWLNSRFLRKDGDDSNGTNSLTLGKIITPLADITGLTLASLGTGATEDMRLVVDENGLVKKIAPEEVNIGIANAGGTVQFPVGNNQSIRFAAAGDASVSFNPVNNTITYNSIPGSGSGGVVLSVFGRDGSVVAEEGDYSTTLVTEGDNKYFTEPRVLSTVLTGLSTGTSSNVVGTDNILQAIGKLQAQSSLKAVSSRTLEVSGSAGRVLVSGGPQSLAADREWVVDLVASGVSTGTYPKVTVDTYGRVIAGASLIESDVPALDISKVTGLETALNNRELTANKATNFTALNNTLYPTTQAVADYVTSQTPAAQTLSQPAIGQLAISGGNTINLNTVNMSGNQTGISGNKTWTGVQNFNNFSNFSLAGSSTGSRFFLQRGGINRWGFYINAETDPLSTGSQGGNFRLFAFDNQGNSLGSFLDVSRSGTVTIPNLSGTGNGIVGVNASGTLTRRAESDVIQTLSLGTSSGNIAISGGNNVSLSSLGVMNKPDANTELVTGGGLQVFSNASGSINYPTTTGGGLKYRRSAGSIVGSFDIWKNVHATDTRLRYRVGLADEYSPWLIFASEEWANAQGWLKAADLPAQVNSDWNATSGAAEILNKPTTIAASGITDVYDKTEVDGLISGIPLPEIDSLTLAEMQTGTSTDNKLVSAKNLYDWVHGLGFMNVGSNISLLNNNAGYIVGGTDPGEVRTNTQLDLRYLQTELDPTVPSHVKTIAIGDITGWNNKLSGITGGTNVTIDNTNPLSPVINVSVPPSGITGMLGDVTSTGTGNVVTTISNNAVTTSKIAANAVTLDKLDSISKGTLLGLGGSSSNPWTVATPDLGTTFPTSWGSNTTYSNGARTFYSNTLYQATNFPTLGVPPSSEPARWTTLKTNFYGYYNAGTTYSAGATIYNYQGDSKYYTTSASTTGVSPDYVPPATPGSVSEVTLGPGLSLGEDNVLRVTSTATSITGMVQAGSNMTITGSGTLASPYIFNASGSGGGGGSSTLSGLVDTDIVGPGVNQVLTWSGTTWQNKNNPAATVFTKTSNGIVPMPGSGTPNTHYLGADGTWRPIGSGGGITAISQATDVLVSSPAVGQVMTWNGTAWQNQTPSGGGSGGGGISALTGDVTASGSGSVPATISNGVVTNAKLANMPANTIKGRLSTSGAPQDLDGSQVRRILNNTYNLVSSTIINTNNGNKQFASISTNTTYSFVNFDPGLEVQVEITNTSGSAVTASFSGGTLPNGVDGSIPAGKTAVFSMTKFQSVVRITKVIF